jgi:tRNA (mo5U34)-methyltransferase
VADIPDDLAEWVGSRSWYHTIDLGGVVTPGWFDLRDLAPQLPFGNLADKRCLDVGTFDGFWALEMERRGAREVIAVDELDPRRWDWPTRSAPETVADLYDRHREGSSFPRVREVLGSRVNRRHCNVYDLDPENLGRFDLAYVGSLLLHLRDPVRALERVRAMLVTGGRLILVDAIDAELTLLHPSRPLADLDGRGRPWWWKPNLAGLGRMVEAAGFELEGKPKWVYMKPGAGQQLPRPRLRSLRSRSAREAVLTKWKGEPHGLVVARQPE